MDFISNQQAQVKEMLTAIGVKEVDELFADIAKDLRLKRPEKDDGLSEYEGLKLMEALASKNSYPRFDNYLGAGAYEHHVPALVAAVCGKSEFLTAYTPYQPETSQGMLQIIFEFQSAICALTGLDVSNASLYDGASACSEAVLMALRKQKGRNRVLVTETLHPHYRGVIDCYLQSLVQDGVEVATIPMRPDGSLDFVWLKEQVNDKTAAILVQSPNFLGVIEEMRSVTELAKQSGILTVLCANPLAYGVLASAGELGVDIAIGDVQPLGLPMQFGGPYAGYIACRQELVRQMPGRIVGETLDTKGRRGFVLTLQAREQHIRREKATSNICTNQALAALASLVTMLWYGKEGVKKLALTNFQRAAYLKEQLAAVPGVTLLGTQPGFNEFVIKVAKPLEQVQRGFRERQIEPGVDLGRYYKELQGHLLVTVTETKSKEQLDKYVRVASTL